MSKTIKKTYSDALFWAMSPASKGKPYHITRTEESILRKLIHYDSTNPKITYSNQWIANHTFLDVTTIEKAIPSINKKGFITTVSIKINDGNGGITSRRTINLNWDFVSKVLVDVPKNELIETEDSLPIAEELPQLEIESDDDDSDDDIVIGFDSIEQTTQKAIPEAKEINGVLHVPNEIVNYSSSVRELVRENLQHDPKAKYQKVVLFFDYGYSTEVEVMKVYDEFNPSLIYMLRSYIEKGIGV